ncbi:lipopolysaccharide biosynthesis protein [Taklimakanibacter deserti]|uniref:lipopolysaccharide biosynthesis protein n=1 Tax=Taklimakanibacter deserti TaxID=2267839 RepID=UPI000E65B0A7
MSARKLITRLFGVVGARAAGAAFGLLSQLALARAFSPADVGIFLLTTSIMAFASLLITGGYTALGLTYLARYESLARKTLVAAYHAAALRTTLIWTIVMAMLAVVAYFTPALADLRPAILFGAIAAPGQALIRLNNSAANSLRRFDLSFVPDFVLRSGFLFAAIIAIIALAQHPRMIWILWAIVISTYAAALIQAVLLGRSGVVAKIFSRQRRSLAPYYRLRAAALLIGAFVSFTFAEIVTLVAGLLLPPADVAVVGIAVRLASIAGFVVQTMQVIAIPDLTDTMAKGTHEATDQLMRRTNLVNCALMTAAILVTLVLGDWVLAFFGPEYRAGKWLLILFLLSQTVRSAGAMNNHLLSLGGHQSRTAIVCAIALVVLIGAAAGLIPYLGINGMGWATLAAEIVWAIGLALSAQALTGRRGDLLARIGSGAR